MGSHPPRRFRRRSWRSVGSRGQGPVRLRTVEIDRESIERRDFPTVRRGYDQAAVDAHLRAVATEVQELARRTEGAGEHALGSATATQVKGILDAAQATAAEIEREARSDAQRIREEAAQDAERAREHVETLARATAALRERVQVLDGEVGALAEGLRIGEGEPPATALTPPVSGPSVVPSAPAPVPAPPEPASAPSAFVSQVPAPAQPAPASVQGANDLDGARLVALNMALNGESRERADRYLADSFQLADRAKLLDEVYAVVEG